MVDAASSQPSPAASAESPFPPAGERRRSVSPPPDVAARAAPGAARTVRLRVPRVFVMSDVPTPLTWH